jgi:hypothetical protein
MNLVGQGLNRPIWRILLLVLISANTAYQMWRTWGQPEFWALVIAGLILGLVAAYAGKNRREDLQARQRGARTFGL